MKKCDATVYYRLKPNYPDTILWFHVGEVYQSFAEDAVETAKILNLHVHDAEDVECKAIKLCVFPVYAVDAYLHKMVKSKHKIGLCQQLDAPKNTGVQPTLF